MFILDALDTIDCGNGVGIPGQLAHIIAMVVNFIYIGVPILLIIWGMLDLGKAIISQKEDDIKKGQSTFVKRLIAALIVFFVVVIVKFLVGLVAEGGSEGTVVTCIDKILRA